jgi:hypothetical protein
MAKVSGFCLRSALIELFQKSFGKQTIAWGAATLVAIIGTQILLAFEIVDLSESIYLSDSLFWGGAALGGVMFGFGMMLTRGCAARHIILAMSGNLRSWMVLIVMGLVSYMTLRGILGPMRQALESALTFNLDKQGIAGLNILQLASQDNPALLTWASLGILVILFLFIVARQKVLSGSITSLIYGASIGLLIPAGWYLTGVLGFDDFDPAPLVSLTFVAPVGNSIQYLMTYTGASSDFGIASVGGVLIGALAITLFRGQWVLDGFDTPMLMIRYCIGAGLMGTGGVLALGCSIGQGLTGLSTLSLTSLISVSAIVVGAKMGFLYVRRQRGIDVSPLPA